MLTTKTIHELLGIDEVFKAPDTLMKILFNKSDREERSEAGIREKIRRIAELTGNGG